MAVWLALWLAASVAVAQQSPVSIISSFNGGQLGSLLEGRFDYPKYTNSCRSITNFIPMLQGPLARRPGTKYIYPAYSTYRTRLIPFEYSTDVSYVLAFSEKNLRVYSGDAPVMNGRSPYSIATPYSASELRDVQYALNDNAMYMVHGSHPPQKLVAAGDTDWTISDVNFTTGPFLAENVTTTSITPSAATGTITLTASSSIFQTTHVGALWKLTYPLDSNSTGNQLIVGPNLSGTAILVRPGQVLTYTISTTEDWSGAIALQTSPDKVTWSDVVAIVLTANQSTGDTLVNTGDVSLYYRLTITQVGESGFRGQIVTTGMDVGSVVRITAVASGTSATATVLNDLVSTASTKRWSEGAWSDYRGWPRTVQFYEQRLVFGGSASYPQTLWFTKTANGSYDDYENMTISALADSAMIYRMGGQNPIQWMNSHTYLMIGTSSSVGRLGKVDEGLTAINPPAFRMQSQQGSKLIQAVTANDSLLFVERSGRKVRELQYELQSDSFVAPDLTALCPDITSSGIVEIAVQNRPQTVVWAVLANGQLISLTYYRSHEVAAWANHTTTGSFESIAVIPGTDEDEVWVEVSRANGRYIERLTTMEWGADANDCWFLDSAVALDVNTPGTIYTVSKSATATITLTTGKYANNDQVQIAGVVGMTQLNGNVYTLKNRTLSGSVYTYSLYDETGAVRINSAGFGTYASGGTTQRVENTFAGLSHLEGQAVSVWAGGGYRGSFTVASGSIGPVDRWLDANEPIVVGLPYTSSMETLPLMREYSGGAFFPNKKRIMKVLIDVYNSINSDVSANRINWHTMTDAAVADDVVPVLQTGFYESVVECPLTRNPTVSIRQTYPYPLTVRAIAATLQLNPN